jgi:GR25 family glycosyltransferase involved in LPS biosynthesis
MYKSFIINLSKVESSYNSAVRLQESLKKFNLDAELFEGSYGHNTLEQYIKSNRFCHDWGLKGPDNLYSEEVKKTFLIPGLIGCFDSHYRLWQKCVELNEPIIIFEDDIIIQREFIPVDWKDVLSVAFSHSKKYLLYKDYLDSPSGDPFAAPYKQSTMPGNGGYAIKPHAAKVLVDAYKNSFLPADNAINQYLVTIQIHSYMMGKALSKKEGNVSLIRTKYWNSN